MVGVGHFVGILASQLDPCHQSYDVSNVSADQEGGLKFEHAFIAWLIFLQQKLCLCQQTNSFSWVTSFLSQASTIVEKLHACAQSCGILRVFAITV